MPKAAKHLGIHPVTLRQWAVDGKIPFSWVDVEKVKRGGVGLQRPRLEVLYVRVSGSSGRSRRCSRRRRSCG